ncbi:MAG: atzF [Verrucomicrobiales bacterium]|nr:atzF [Verrucomicrobiales bacterium]
MILSELLASYRSGEKAPRTVVLDLLRALHEDADQAIFIHLLTDAEVEPWLAALDGKDPDSLPLYGVPFAIKDNIDLAGIPTTAACPDFTRTPSVSATVVQRLIDAGAIPLGKTNLDQLATGLVGVRSPYGIPKNPWHPDYIPGGSSSGSAVAVARGFAAFALGTDTAGSGRVPASFNHLFGVKPTCGLLSTSGVVPACRTLDCVSIFANNAADAATILNVAAALDAADPYSRPLPPQPARSWSKGMRLGVPREDQLEFFGNTAAADLFAAAVETARSLGAEIVPIDLTPFLETARLLYEGPWVSERTLTAEPLLKSNPDALLPVTRRIIEGGVARTATDTFSAFYRLADNKLRAARAWTDVDAILTPTAGTPYTVEEVLADPIRLNSNLGHYTNFMNLLDLAALAIPAGFLPQGMPWGVTVFAPAFTDWHLLEFAARWPAPSPPDASAPSSSIHSHTPSIHPPVPVLEIAVCGAHLDGLPLNHQLTSRGGWLVRATKTAPHYQMVKLPGGPPHRPGLIRKTEVDGAAIKVEIWALPLPSVGSFLAGIPSPLGLGTVQLEDGSSVCGFICEGFAAEGALDITHTGGWRAWLGSPRPTG